jgi:hypothetical protein
VTSDQAVTVSSSSHLGPGMVRSTTSNVAQSSMQIAPARLGSIARRPGADARRQRIPTTAAVPTEMAT